MTDSSWKDVALVSNIKDIDESAIDKAYKEINELMAHCGRQSSALLGVKNKLPEGAVKGFVAHIYESTPKQSLAKHDAEVIKKFIRALPDELNISICGKSEDEHLLNMLRTSYNEALYDVAEVGRDYANKLEAGEL